MSWYTNWHRRNRKTEEWDNAEQERRHKDQVGVDFGFGTSTDDWYVNPWGDMTRGSGPPPLDPGPFDGGRTDRFKKPKSAVPSKQDINVKTETKTKKKKKPKREDILVHPVGGWYVNKKKMRQSGFWIVDGSKNKIRI